MGLGHPGASPGLFCFSLLLLLPPANFWRGSHSPTVLEPGRAPGGPNTREYLKERLPLRTPSVRGDPRLGGQISTPGSVLGCASDWKFEGSPAAAAKSLLEARKGRRSPQNFNHLRMDRNPFSKPGGRRPANTVAAAPPRESKKGNSLIDLAGWGFYQPPIAITYRCPSSPS